MSTERSKLFCDLADAPPRGRVRMTNRVVMPRRNLTNRRKHAVRVGQVVYAMERVGEVWKTVPYIVTEIDDCARWYRSAKTWRERYGVENALAQPDRIKQGWMIYYWCLPLKRLCEQWQIGSGGFGHGGSMNDEFYLTCAECNFSRFYYGRRKPSSRVKPRLMRP